MAGLLPNGACRPCLGGSCGSDRTTLDSLADIGLEGAAVVGWRCKTWECADPPHQPKRGRIYAGTNARVTALKSYEGRYGDAQALGPGSLGLPAADPGDGQIFAQSPEGLGSGRRQSL